MNITLPPDVKSNIDRQIESGHFVSTEEVIAEAVRQMEDLSVPAELLTTALEQSNRGEGRALTEEVMRELLARARTSAEQGHRVRDEVRYRVHHPA